MRGRDLILVLAWAILPSCAYVDNPNATDAAGEEDRGSTTDNDDSTTPGDGDPGDGDGDWGGGDGDSGNGDGDSGDGEGQAPEAPLFELSLSQVKQFDFAWMPVPGAQYYQLLESADMGEPHVQVGQDLLGLETSLTVPLHFRLNASYKLRACNDVGCTDSEAVDVVGPLVEAIGYFKASNTSSDRFGASVALSGDGNTLAVGACLEDSSATGIGGNQADDSSANAGAVYVFVRDDQNAWSQQAYIKASNTDAGDRFGVSVALSDDGNTLAVGADAEDSSASGVGGYQVDNSVDAAGAAYVFVRDGQNAWSQQAYVKASNTGAIDQFGSSVALSGTGDTLAVGASWEDSGADGIGGDQVSNSASAAGAVYVFVRYDQNAWAQQAYVKASNSGMSDWFGDSVALSGDGATLAVGASGESSSATGIDGNEADDSAYEAGAVYVFVRDDQNAWSQQAYIKASNTEGGPEFSDEFGSSVALSGDGNTLAVSAIGEDSTAQGIGGDQAADDSNAYEAGAVYVFARNGQNQWSQQAYVKASNTGGDWNLRFGQSVTLSGSGSTLAVGARGEGSIALGVGGNQAYGGIYGGVDSAGAVYVFVRDGQNTWSQQVYVKASNTDEFDGFGCCAALSGDGNTLAIGASSERSAAMGIGGNQADNSTVGAGAVYLY